MSMEDKVGPKPGSVNEIGIGETSMYEETLGYAVRHGRPDTHLLYEDDGAGWVCIGSTSDGREGLMRLFVTIEHHLEPNEFGPHEAYEVVKAGGRLSDLP